MLYICDYIINFTLVNVPLQVYIVSQVSFYCVCIVVIALKQQKNTPEAIIASGALQYIIYQSMIFFSVGYASSSSCLNLLA